MERGGGAREGKGERGREVRGNRGEERGEGERRGGARNIMGKAAIGK